MLTNIIIIALAASFIILLITKIGLRDKMIENSPFLISKMFNCDFCLSFWVSVCLVIGIIVGTGDFSYAIIPIFAAPITRVLI